MRILKFVVLRYLVLVSCMRFEHVMSLAVVVISIVATTLVITWFYTWAAPNVANLMMLMYSLLLIVIIYVCYMWVKEVK